MAAADKLTPEELAHLEPFRVEARAALRSFTATDASPAVRLALESLGTSILMAWSVMETGRDRRQAMEEILKSFAEVVEQFPLRLAAIETRLETLERRR